MLDIKFVTDNINLVKKALVKRGGNYPIDEIATLNLKRRELIGQVEGLKAKRNAVSDEIAVLKRQKQDAANLIQDMKAVGECIKELDAKLSEIQAQIEDHMLSIPNILADVVPMGKDETANKEIRRHLTPTEFDFEPKAHWDIGENLNILDFARAGKITGSRFAVYRGLGASLERAIYNFMLDTHIKHGYVEIFPPFMVNRESLYGTGNLPKFEDALFKVQDTNYYLIPTAEVPVTNLHRNEILDPKQLPIKYCAYSANFRSEAGAAGRDTRGIIRTHQFNKVEIVKFAHPDTSYDELESLTNDAERILQLLEIPYRVVLLCSGDTGFSSHMTYDIEVWLPSYNRYVEISSCSNFSDFQARRANIKYRDQNGKAAFAHTLNGSGLAVSRTTAAVLENFQNKNGTVNVPKVLQKYMGVEVIG